MAVKAKAVICKVSVKEDSGKMRPCGATYLTTECPNRGEHMLPFPTGFCAVGACEGKRRQSPSGRNMRTCDQWKYCPCACHLVYDQMYSISEMTRVIVDNSGYVPEHGHYVRPEIVVTEAPSPLSTPTPVDTPVALQSAAPGLVPPDAPRSFGATTSGRAAKGELERWVKRTCDEWVVEKYEFPCTPQWIAEEIAQAEGIKAPSTGAVSAVFDRWIALGFAVCAKKPTRFMEYTPEAIQVGLDELKDRAKRSRRSHPAQALVRRG